MLEAQSYSGEALASPVGQNDSEGSNQGGIDPERGRKDLRVLSQFVVRMGV